MLGQLDGVTTQSTKVADAIRNGEIKVSVLGDELFDRYFGSSQAMAQGNKIYLRRESEYLFSESVHEGTHVLDYLDGFGMGGSKTVWQWEKRAWFYERQYQKASGGNVEFDNVNDMLFNIYRNYDNVPYNPY